MNKDIYRGYDIWKAEDGGWWHRAPTGGATSGPFETETAAQSDVDALKRLERDKKA